MAVSGRQSVAGEGTVVELDGFREFIVARSAVLMRSFVNGALRGMVAVSIVAVSALTADAVIAGTASTGHGHGQLAAGRNHTMGPRHQAVNFQGIVFTLPPGWITAKPGCGWPASDTVVINDHAGPFLGCPFPGLPAPRPTSVTLSTLYGPRYALSWSGHRTTWRGLPAWLAAQTKHGTTTVTLSLPWLNTAIAAASPDSARARALLRQASLRPGAGFTVPPVATSVFIQSLAGRDGDGQRRNATVTAAPDVRRVLADLRSLQPIRSPRSGCDGSWWPNTALVTVRGGGGRVRTYAARFGSCSQVVAGTGTAATASGQLLADIRHLVPNSGL